MKLSQEQQQTPPCQFPPVTTSSLTQGPAVGLMPTDGVGTDHPFTPQKKISVPPRTRGQESPLRGRQCPWRLTAAGTWRGHGGAPRR